MTSHFQRYRQIPRSVLLLIVAGFMINLINAVFMLRQWELEYFQIFFITALLYALGVSFYHLLINDYFRRERWAGAELHPLSDTPGL